MSHIYIIRGSDKLRHKIGIHTGTINALNRRYRTAIPELEIKLFEKVPSALEIEKEVLKKFREKRIPHATGRPSEWMKIEYPELEKCVKSLIRKQKTKKKKDEESEWRYCVLF
jgi:T5orf172 domain.